MKKLKYIKTKHIAVIAILILSFFVMHIVRAVGSEPATDDILLVSKDYVDGKINELTTRINNLESELKEQIEQAVSENKKNDENETSKEEISEDTTDGQTEADISEQTEQSNLQLDQLMEKLNKLEEDTGQLKARTIAVENNDGSYLGLILKQNQKISNLETGLREIESVLDGLVEKVNLIQQSPLKYDIVVLKSGKQLIVGASTEILLRGGSATAIGSSNGGLIDITSGSGLDITEGQNIPLNHLLVSARDDGRGMLITSEKAWIMVKGWYMIK